MEIIRKVVLHQSKQSLHFQKHCLLDRKKTLLTGNTPVFRRCPKSVEGEVIEKTFIHKIRDREEGIVIYSFYTWFSFLTWV